MAFDGAMTLELILYFAIDIVVFLLLWSDIVRTDKWRSKVKWYKQDGNKYNLCLWIYDYYSLYYHQFIVSSVLVLVMIKGIPLLRTSIAARSLQGMHLWYIKPVARLTTKSTLMDTFPAVVIPMMIPYSLNLRVSTPVLVTLDLQWLVANNLLISTLPTASVHHHWLIVIFAVCIQYGAGTSYIAGMAVFQQT